MQTPFTKFENSVLTTLMINLKSLKFIRQKNFIYPQIASYLDIYISILIPSKKNEEVLLSK